MTDDPFLSPPRDRAQAEPAQPTAAQPVPTQPTAAPPPPPMPAMPSGSPEGYVPAPNLPGQPAQYDPAQYNPAQQYAQPTYANYPPPAGYYAGPKPKTWMSWVAFGCGLAVFVTCVSGIAAIVFGHLALSASKRGEADYQWAAITGLVLGYLSLVGILFYIAMFATAFSTGY